VRRETFNIGDKTKGSDYPIIWYLASGIWHPVSGIRHPASGI